MATNLCLFVRTGSRARPSRRGAGNRVPWKCRVVRRPSSIPSPSSVSLSANEGRLMTPRNTKWAVLGSSGGAMLDVSPIFTQAGPSATDLNSQWWQPYPPIPVVSAVHLLLLAVSEHSLRPTVLAGLGSRYHFVRPGALFGTAAVIARALRLRLAGRCCSYLPSHSLRSLHPTTAALKNGRLGQAVASPPRLGYISSLRGIRLGRESSSGRHRSPHSDGAPASVLDIRFYRRPALRRINLSSAVQARCESPRRLILLPARFCMPTRPVA